MGTRYAQLSVEERRKIERWRLAKISVDEMARALGRHRSTIFRKLWRNHFQDRDFPRVVGYFAMAAQCQTADRRARHRKLVRHDALRETVEARLKAGWTPEQIAGRMRLEGARLRVRQETIYRHVYSKDGMRSELWWHLPNHRMSRRPRRARKRLPPKFGREVSILFRPEAVAHRTEFGHWEGDLVLFRQRFGQANVTLLMERVSRFTVLLRNTTKRSKPVMGKIARAIGTLPLPARKPITFDRGSEFATWPHLEAETGTRS
jgi:IS30 family transposase